MTMSRILTLDGDIGNTFWLVQGIMKEEHWQIMLKARAIENGCYVIAPIVGTYFRDKVWLSIPLALRYSTWVKRRS
jgi:predicted amidohydrolase